MGRKKGKQAGNFRSKSEHAEHRHTHLVDRASEANQYRNPMTDLGSGCGYRNDSVHNDSGSAGFWSRNGTGYGGGDKWSGIFSSAGSSRATQPMPSRDDISRSGNTNRATMGLSRLRFLLEERRSEDRMHDRQHRLRIQRSRMMEAYNEEMTTTANNIRRNSPSNERHEPGWLLSYSKDESYTEEHDLYSSDALQSIFPDSSQRSTRTNGIPSLQNMAARALGPLLPMYCASCGSDFVGESLKSVSVHVLSDLAISLAMSDWSIENDSNSGGAMFATTDGAVKALVHSGVATGLVLRGAPLLPLSDCAKKGVDHDDARWLSDDGLLSLIPRIDGNMENSCDSSSEGDSHASHESSCDHWETLDFDTSLNSRMSGCFHLKRLELIDVPLRRQYGPSSGISIHVLRTVLRSCSNITHLSLGGCFYNWEDADCLPASLSSAGGESSDIGMLLGGSPSISRLTHTFEMLDKLHGKGGETIDIIPHLLFPQMFQDDDKRSDVPGVDSFLPELEVLDVSRCSWLTIPMIVQFLLNCWALTLTSNADWKEIQLVDEEENLFHSNKSRHSPSESERSLAKINTSLRYLNIRGCMGLLQPKSFSPSWIEQWRGHGLFNGIHVSAHRKVRK